MRRRTMLPIIGALALATACGDTSQLDGAFGPNSVPDGTIVLEQSRFEGDAGDTASLRAFVLDRRGRRFHVEDLSWESADSSIAVVDSAGQLFLVQPGETQLSVSFRGTRLAASVRASNKVTISKVDVFPEPLDLAVGDERGLGLYIHYSNGNTIRNKLGVNWSSNDPSVVSINGSGRISALKAGTARIIAKRGKFADTVSVTVASTQEKKPAAPTLSIAPDTGQVRVTEVFSFSTALSTGEKSPSGVTWTITDPTIASISTGGELTGKKEGVTTVRATRDGKSVSAVLRVTPAPKAAVPAEESKKEEESDKQGSEPKETDQGSTGSSNSGSSTPPPAAAPPPPPPASSGNVAELPREFLDTRMPSTTGKTIRVPANGNLQAALDAAQPGDRVLLAPNATYVGSFRLKPKSGSGWIVVQTETSLPAEGVRMTPSLATSSRLAKLVSPGDNKPALQTDPKAAGWRIVGVEITVRSSETNLNTLVRLGSSSRAEQGTLADVPTRIVLDRTYIHGTATLTLIRCIQLQSASTAIIDSWVSDCHAKGFDSQAIVGWNGPGPFKIVNNYLEGAGENVMFGGANPTIAGLVPSDIEFRRNHVFKPTSWQGRWTVKNLFELKMGRRILIEGNVFENVWVDGQRGNAFVLKSDNGQTADITIRYNIIRNAAQGAISLAARVASATVLTRNISISHNLMYDLGAESSFSGGQGLGISVLGSARGAIDNLHVRHNTIIAPHGPIALYSDGSPPLGKNFVFSENLALHGTYGVQGSGGTGLTTVKNRYSSYSFEKNVFYGGSRFTAGAYPASTTYYPNVTPIGFVSPQSGDFRLSASSVLHSASLTAGVNFNDLTAATKGVVISR